MSHSAGQQRGVALLVVLWVLALLSLLLGGLAGWVQLESRQALWLRQNTQALLAAEGGMNMAVQGLLDTEQRKRWVADGRMVALRLDDTQLVVSVRSERGKLDLNSAPVADISRVLQACGAARSQASSIAQVLEAQRNGGQSPLRVVEEVRQLPGMTQTLYTRLLPEITLWSGLDRPDSAFASGLLRRALNLPNQSAVGADPGEVLTIDSRAERPGGITAFLQTTVLLSPSEGSAQPYRVLRWQE
ncbi:type II secretion system protein GspK [Pseudomonas cannabina]|uniref:Proteinral secretion pathway protein GspK n=3 Tax=Pseudomonas syringae group TaxID=136849 RepID=A0A3M3QZR4_PSECA|nr:MULTISPECIES: type II secretion system protein GspK [Pseudomonas syringae group]KPB71734.1 General secretion pathway protein GspK [Pseudomonas syringae pv. maculicola]MBM0138384.1 general secretion pathway protein GspK [Pseudomonas cannabina pv. alisalensis]QHE97626.1 general secretion pathway protein GspK [Pseudomonas syringae pv. maculicola str. ES4326]QQN24125.1 general secretion pathway protein GspK [Pseudomonas cannabina pv. alisalensis]RMN80398.1 proteinral secretion pathway protein G